MAAKAGTSDGRRPLQPPGAGDNSAKLTEEERAALFLSHMQTIRANKANLDRAMETVKALRKPYNTVRNTARGDGFPLKLIDEILEAEATSRVELGAEEQTRNWMRQQVGLPVGSQGDLFAAPARGEPTAEEAEAEGYLAGIRGEDANPPATLHPSLHPAWLKGRDNGQERNAWALSAAGKITDRRTDIGAGGPVQLEPIDEDQNEGAPEDEPGSEETEE